MKNFFPYLIIAGLIFYIFLQQTCTGRDDAAQKENKVEFDTVFITKTIPGKTIASEDTNPQPVVERDNTELIEKIATLESDNERLQYLLNELSLKIYDSTYTFGRGRLRLVDTVQGSLLGRYWKLDLDPIEYQEKTVTKTITKYPKWAFSIGLDTGLETDFASKFKKPFIGLDLGFRNKKGYTIQFGYNSQEQFEIGLTKDIFVKY